MKIAATQFAPLFKASSRNIETMSALVKAAASHGAELIVLPELATSGYSFLSENEARTCAEILTDDPGILKRAEGEIRPNSVSVMKSLSIELGIAIAWGLVEEDPGTGDLFNSQMLVLPTGEWVSTRKLNRWSTDFLWAKAGRASPAILEYNGKKVGLLICRDIRDEAPNMAHLYEPGDADIVCFSSNFGKGGFPAVSWMDFVKDNHITLIVSNRYGVEANHDFGSGGVCIITPPDKVNCEGLVWGQPCIVYGDV